MSPSTASDVRYGRRGGRRANPQTPKPRRTRSAECCDACARPVPRWNETGKDPGPVCCGRLWCRAQLTWTAAQWEGAARMAASRRRLGLPLTPLDRQALDIAQEEHG